MSGTGGMSLQWSESENGVRHVFGTNRSHVQRLYLRKIHIKSTSIIVERPLMNA